MSKRAKEVWEEFGAKDAFWAVSTFDKYRAEKLEGSALEEFYASGDEHVEHIFSQFERRFGRTLAPQSSMDYGCGVGRVLVALAGRSETVTGVDIAETMLEKAAAACKERGADNVELLSAAEFLCDTGRRYDLIHSYIVLQHIEPRAGYEIIRKMLRRLEPGGAGMLHLTYRFPAGRFERFRLGLYRRLPFVYNAVNLIRGRRSDILPMYEYDLAKVFELLRENGCADFFIELTDHGWLGASIYFLRSESA